jgi:type I restriction enzyme S subunit
MQYSVENFSLVNNSADFRIDAEHYSSATLNNKRMISEIPHINFFDEIMRIESGKNLVQSDEGKIAFLRTQNIQEILIEPNNVSFTKQTMDTCEEGDLLFVRVGEGVGRSSVISTKFIDYAYSDNILRLKLKNIEPHYCTVFLNSSLGKIYFRSFFKGSARSLISSANFKNLLIPRPSRKFQTEIKNLVLYSDDLLFAARNLLNHSESLLLKQLDLNDWRPEKQLSFVANYSETEEASRIDADYFQPHYKGLLEHFSERQISLTSFAESVELRDKNYQPDAERNYRYIELSNIARNGQITGFTEANGAELPSRARRITYEGDVIISSIEGSLQSVALVTAQEDGALCSTGFYVAHSEIYNPETLLILMKSIIGQTQLKRGCKGTILTAISKDELNRIKLPLITAEIQQEIKQLVQQMYQQREESKRLLETAKRAVEIAIEEDEPAAFRFIEQETT